MSKWLEKLIVGWIALSSTVNQISHVLGIENDPNDYANLPKKNGLKFFVPSSTGYCSCGTEWDGHQVKGEWLDVECCLVVYLYTLQHVNGERKHIF